MARAFQVPIVGLDDCSLCQRMSPIATCGTSKQNHEATGVETSGAMPQRLCYLPRARGEGKAALMFYERFVPARVRHVLDTMKALQPTAKRTCPICGTYDFFAKFGTPPRPEAMCRHCGSLERHRLLWLWLVQQPPLAQPVVHFAPEKIFEERFRALFADYRTADLFAAAELRLDLESIDLPENSVGTVIGNHVLEHVDDRKALAELFRVLKPGGLLIASVPLIEGWETTYENAAVQPHERVEHYGQHDHVRYYGRDFRDRVRAAGFELTEFTASGADAVSYGLIRGDKVFFAQKPM